MSCQFDVHKTNFDGSENLGITQKEFVKFFEDNANQFKLDVLSDNKLNLDTIAKS